MKGVFTTYKITGLNLDGLINSLKRRGFTLYNVRKKNNNTLYFTVSKSQDKKVFAISKELCYNIKRVRYSGAFLPLVKLVKNVGLLLGVVACVFIAYASNDFIFSFSFSGNGKAYSLEVERYLITQGIDKFSRFSKIDLSSLADNIVKSSNRFSFASCKKRGNVLEIDLALNKDQAPILTGKEKFLKADVCGVIESLTVYRGCAHKSVGDRVQVGDVIVDGNIVVKDQPLLVNVIANCVITARFDYTYTSELDGQEDYAILFAKSVLEQDVLEEKIEKKFKNGRYNYVVSLFYRRVYHVG